VLKLQPGKKLPGERLAFGEDLQPRPAPGIARGSVRTDQIALAHHPYDRPVIVDDGHCADTLVWQQPSDFARWSIRTLCTLICCRISIIRHRRLACSTIFNAMTGCEGISPRPHESANVIVDLLDLGFGLEPVRNIASFPLSNDVGALSNGWLFALARHRNIRRLTIAYL
jgi:hypothetical protein